MAWREVEQDEANGFTVYEETLTLPSAASTDTDSSAITFAPEDGVFTIHVNVDATNTSSDFDAAVLASYDGSNFGLLADDIVTSGDTAYNVVAWDPVNNSSHAAAPQYKIRLDHDGNQSAESVKIAIAFR